MKVIGLTGGVGSGKSYVAQIAEKQFDVLHINTDNISKRQIKKGGASYDGVVSAFGEDILCEDGEIDRKKLAAIVFNNEDKLKLLESLTHPNVRKTVDAIIDAAGEDYEAVLVETAIFKKSGYEEFCDELWIVTAPVEQRIERLMSDRGYTKEQCNAIINNQSENYLYSIPVYEIVNDREDDNSKLIEKIGSLLK